MENKEIILGAQLELPVGCLNGDYKKLLAELTIANPKFITASMFARGKVNSNIPKKLFFFGINESNRSIIIPRNIDKSYFNTSGYSVINNISIGREISIGYNSKFSLRDYQQRYFDNTVFPYIDANKDNNTLDLLLNAECGSGKTIMALYLASIHRTKTIICVPKIKLGKQFQTAVKELFPKWTVGWEEGKGIDYDITIGTYDLLSDSKYTSDYFKRYGHIILDEFHRCGAETYSKILSKAPCKYRTSLTATFRRKDGLHEILKHHTGDILEMESNSDKAVIFPVTTGFSINEYLFRKAQRFPVGAKSLAPFSEVSIRTKKTLKTKKTEEVDRGLVTSISRDKKTYTINSGISTGKTTTFKFSETNIFKLGTISAPMVDTEIASYPTRNDLAKRLIRQSYTNGRKIIVLSKRKEQLLALEKTLRRYGINAGLFMSNKSKEYKDYCKFIGRTIEEQEKFVFEESRVILGIDKLAEEGMDAPSFDTLLYLHPVKDIEQGIGRILRQMDGKKKPVCFFLIDKVNSYKNSYYGKKGAENMFIDLGHEARYESDLLFTLKELNDLDNG